MCLVTSVSLYKYIFPANTYVVGLVVFGAVMVIDSTNNVRHSKEMPIKLEFILGDSQVVSYFMGCNRILPKSATEHLDISKQSMSCNYGVCRGVGE